MKDLLEHQIQDTLLDKTFVCFDVNGNTYGKDEYRKEREVLRYYDEPYDILTAKYVSLKGSRATAKQNLERACLVVICLNPNVTENRLKAWARSKVSRFSGTLLKQIEANGVATSAFELAGVEKELLITTTSIRWMSMYPKSNPFDIKTNREQFFEYVSKQRQVFALKAYTKVRSQKAELNFLNSYAVAKDLYGDVSMEDVASIMGVQVQAARRTHKKILEVVTIDAIQFKFKDKRYIESQRKILKSGEEIHEVDRLLITKSRVSRKAEVSRPTVNNHWPEVEVIFRDLNVKLKQL